MITILLIFLIKNLKKTLYSYKNVILLSIMVYIALLDLMAISDIFQFIFHDRRLGAELYLTKLLYLPETFTYFALFPLSVMAVFLTVSNIVLIKKEGRRPTNMLGILLSLAYLGGTFFIKDVLHKLVNNINPYITLYFLTLLSYMECILVASAIMGYLAARQKPQYDKDFIIILGCAISKKGGLLPLLRNRTNAAIHYAWEQEIASGKPLKYVPSGGQGPDEIMSEGSAMELYLLSHGAEQDEVFAEKKSRNTYENFLFSKKIIDELNPNARIAFSTTNYHMLRSGLIAQSIGIDAEGIAGKTKWYFWPNGFVREFIAILKMHLKSHIIFALCTLVIYVVMSIFVR